MATNRLFLFPYEYSLDKDVLTKIDEALLVFLDQWNSHGSQITTRNWVEENQFVFIAVNEETTSASGCSKDTLFGFFKKLNSSLGISGGRLNKFYVQTEDKISLFSKHEIKEALDNGNITLDSNVYPTWISSEEEYDQIWKKPLEAYSILFKLNQLK